MSHEDAASGLAATMRRLEGRIRRTPLREVTRAECPNLPDGVRVFLKLECTQVSGAFKARGARNFIARLLDDAPPAGVITYSSGNHGRAVAEAAAAAEIPALITVPTSIDPSKEAAILAAGAECVHAGNTSESRHVEALKIAEERGWMVIPPFDHEWIIEGQSTVAAEVFEELPEVTDLWAPVGGGGLSAGCARAIAARAPHVRLHAVEPVGAAAYGASVAAGERVSLESSASVADGLLPLSIGALNWTALQEVSARSVEVTEEQILENLRRLRSIGVEAEPSAAVSSAPLLSSNAMPSPGVHVAVVSGSNVDPARLERLLEGGEEPS